MKGLGKDMLMAKWDASLEKVRLLTSVAESHNIYNEMHVRPNFWYLKPLMNSLRLQILHQTWLGRVMMLLWAAGLPLSPPSMVTSDGLFIKLLLFSPCISCIALSSREHVLGSYINKTLDYTAYFPQGKKKKPNVRGWMIKA